MLLRKENLWHPSQLEKTWVKQRWTGIFFLQDFSEPLLCYCVLWTSKKKKKMAYNFLQNSFYSAMPIFANHITERGFCRIHFSEKYRQIHSENLHGYWVRSSLPKIRLNCILSYWKYNLVVFESFPSLVLDWIFFFYSWLFFPSLAYGSPLHVFSSSNL